MKYDLKKNDNIALQQRRRLYRIKYLLEDTGHGRGMISAVLLALSDNESHMSARLRRKITRYDMEKFYYPADVVGEETPNKAILSS